MKLDDDNTRESGLLPPKKEVVKVVRDQKNILLRQRARERRRFLAVAHYLITGSLQATANSTKIPYYTLVSWKQQDWWPIYEQAIVKKQKITRSTKLRSLADKAAAIVADRLENGDFQYDQKKGEIVRIGVKASAANKILQDSLIHESQTMKEVMKEADLQTQERMIDKLLKIQESFQKAHAKAQETPVELVQNKEGVYALPSERKA